MARRIILQEGDETLTKVSRTVTVFDERLHTLLNDMRETMEHAGGVGLAAPQVGVLRRVVLVLDTDELPEDSETEGTLLELINPEIIEVMGEQRDMEGCLSIPGVMGEVTRPQWVKIRAQDRHGAWFEVEGEGFTSRALCHEIDHLDGLLYTRLADELVSAESGQGA